MEGVYYYGGGYQLFSRAAGTGTSTGTGAGTSHDAYHHNHNHPLMQPDGVTPNTEGYRAWMEEVRGVAGGIMGW